MNILKFRPYGGGAKDWRQIDEDTRARLFDILAEKKEVSNKQVMSALYEAWGKKTPKKGVVEYELNLMDADDKKYPCYETRSIMLKAFKGCDRAKELLKEPQFEESLWHILYSVTDYEECRKAIGKFLWKHGIEDAGEEIARAFAKTKPFESNYASFSAKAIRRLLPLMRCGKYYKEEEIDAKTRARIEWLLNDKVAEGFKEEDIVLDEDVKGQFAGFDRVRDFCGLQTWQASYLVYGWHSEDADAEKWNGPEDIDKWLNKFKQYSLRNPIVEQVMLETMRVVRDIWKKVGTIDEIHLEMVREMSQTAEKKKEDTLKNAKREAENYAIKRFLTECAIQGTAENLNPMSPIQQAKLRIVYEGALAHAKKNGPTDTDKENGVDSDIIEALLKEFSKTEYIIKEEDVKRFKLWVEQHYMSPYTGTPITFSKLFTDDYEIEHVIPRARYTDDSMNNKVICERDVNKDKGVMLGMEYIKKKGGQNVGGFKILTEDRYRQLVDECYYGNSRKRDNMLAEEIPQQFSNQQLQNAKYIARAIMGLLSNIVRTTDESGNIEKTYRSRNLIVCTGSVTDRLKNDWHVNDIWNQIILPRFKRMNALHATQAYTAITQNGHEIPQVPLEHQKNFQKKRVDHRHHAMDAIVIACMTGEIVRYLNNLSAGQVDYTMLRERVLDGKTIRLPWATFPQDVKAALEDIIVSFKHRERILTKKSNKIHLVGRETKVQNTTSVRQAMHKDTVWGKVSLRRTKETGLREAIENPCMIVERDVRKKVKELYDEGMSAKEIVKYFGEHNDEWPEVRNKKVMVYYFTENMYATRTTLLSYMDKCPKDKAVERIEAITDTGIQRILKNHLEACGGDPAVAFSAEGLVKMNDNISELNGGKCHKPINNVRKTESSSLKTALGYRGNKGSKYVEAADGTNLFFAVYEREDVDKETGEVTKKRTYATIGFREALKNRQGGRPAVPESDAQGNKLLFKLSPGDLVYVPKDEEDRGGDMSRVYKFVSCSRQEASFVPVSMAAAIVDKRELTSHNKDTKPVGESVQIKEVCWPLRVDRIGDVIP